MKFIFFKIKFFIQDLYEDRVTVLSSSSSGNDELAIQESEKRKVSQCTKIILLMLSEGRMFAKLIRRLLLCGLKLQSYHYGGCVGSMSPGKRIFDYVDLKICNISNVTGFSRL